MMKKLSKLNLLILVIGFGIISCTDNSNKANNTIAVNHPLKGDTTKPKSKLQQMKDDGAPSTEEILSDLKKSYKTVIKIDTAIVIATSDTAYVHLQNYCTYDNKIDLPARYTNIYGITHLKTHNFESTVDVSFKNKTIFKGIIKKQDFVSLLNDELERYAVLINPNVRKLNKGVEIEYSISVPLSDVGKSVIIKIDTAGNKQIEIDK